MLHFFRVSSFCNPVLYSVFRIVDFSLPWFSYPGFCMVNFMCFSSFFFVFVFLLPVIIFLILQKIFL